MQLQEKVREVATSGVTDSTSFGISIPNMGHIKKILRNNIYSDKILAVLREYSANAWDAHRMVGKTDVPIEVTLPTWSNLSLEIKDFGPGLSHEDMFEVFTQYGTSTKRNTNDAVGMLGIGSKSGFAYSDTFTVVSRHGGKARTYVALLDEADNDALSLLNEQDCGEDTGLTIQIAVRREDVYHFEVRAQKLFQHFVPRPKINITLPEPPAIRSKLQHGIIFDKQVEYYQESSWIAVMGCIPYKVDLSQLRDSDGTVLISESFHKVSGLLQFNIGELQISASREGLDYTKSTKQALVQKFEALMDEFVVVVLDEIEKGTENGWQKRLKAQSLLRLGLGKKEIGDWALSRIHFPTTPKTFVLNRDNIRIDPDSRFVRYTDIGRRKIQGFHLTGDDYLISRTMVVESTDAHGSVIYKKGPNGETLYYTWDEVNVELERLCKQAGIDGIPSVDLHTLPWQPGNGRAQPIMPRTVNPKHHARMFRLDNLEQTGKLSERWVIEKRDPQPDDVYVILEEFQTVQDGTLNFYSARKDDTFIAQELGLTLPPIYGYKTTQKHPVTPASLAGIHYPEWRKQWLQNLPINQIKELIESRAWAKMYDTLTLDSQALGKVIRHLGREHPIAIYVKRVLQEEKHSKPAHEKLIQSLISHNIVKEEETEAGMAFAVLAKSYPLLYSYGFDDLWTTYNSSRSDLWFGYVQLCDTHVPQLDSSPTPEYGITLDTEEEIQS